MGKEGKINLLTLIMIPALVGIGVIIGYIVFANKHTIENSMPYDSNETAEIAENETMNKETQNIEGIFLEDLEEANDSPLFVFYNDGTVIEEGNAVRKGTYEIDNNTIKIKYTVFIAPDETEEEKINEEQELKLVDENTIEGYIKCDVKKSIIGKWSFEFALDSDNQQVEIRDIFGSIVTQNGVGDITFNEDNTFTNYIGAFSSEQDNDTVGTYSIMGDKITLNTKNGKTETIEFISEETLNYPYNNYTFILKKGDLTSNEDNTENDISLRQYIKGYEVKGYIEIPKTNINEPILEMVTKNSLENGFAIAYGPGLNEVGNTVLYVNGTRLYQNNKTIASGDIINITDQRKTKVIYEVYDVQEIDHNDASYMLRDTNGNVEISIQTGSQNPEKRTVIFARKVR